MKTSLNIDDALFKAAQNAAIRGNISVSQVISRWARTGFTQLNSKKKKPSSLKTVDLGGSSLIDINSRRNWMDLLDR